jgi:predicted MFS family arabinose efflux permease
VRLNYVRELDEYPQGLHRLRLLATAVLAILIGSYEAQIAPVVPLLLKDLHISLTTYGSVSAAAAASGAIAAGLGGRLTDHLGRVRLLVPLMMLTAFCCLAMTLVHSTRDLLTVRIVLSFVDGVAIASTAPLVRDFSPRVGRAQAFGFWTWGPVGASLIASALAAWTLPIFHDAWRSQFVIMAAVSFVVSIVIAANVADLSPELRARIQQTERKVVRAADAKARASVWELLRHKRIWAHAVGIALWLVLYVTIAVYGQTALVQSFGISTARASGIMTTFWILDLAVLIAIGRLSDRLQLRKPFMIAGTLAAVVAAGYLIALMGRDSVSTGQIMLAGTLLGASLAVAYSPWMAGYSEDAEDIDPRLQGTAWGIYGFLTRAIAVLVLLAVPRVVAAHDWQTWLTVAASCLLLFVPAVFLFGGPWRAHVGRTAPVEAESPAASVPTGLAD